STRPKDDACHHCKEVRHCKRNCLSYLVELIKKKKQVGIASSLGKMTRKPFLHRTERATDLLGLIHTVVYGPLRHVSRQGASYFITFTDDYSLYCYVYLLKYKHEVFEAFKVFKKEVENQLGKTTKALRSNRGGEYISQEFKYFLKDYGIVQQLTLPYTPQHNDASERKNRTLLDMVRSMMNLTTLLLSFWEYALETATRILNMVPTKKVNKIPYELWYKNLVSQKVSGRTVELEEIQDEDTSPSENTSKIPMEVEGFELPQEEFFPFVEVDEYSLRDPNEPTNYKAALLDSEPDKWVDVMNAKMQSMKDNQVWCLVDLPLNSKGYTQTYGVDYEETFSPVTNIRAIRILIAIAAFHDYEIWKIDVKTAFLNGYLDEDIYMNSGEPHWTAVKTILKYLRNTKDMFLVYDRNPEAKLRFDCYCDVGFETSTDDTKSHTRYVFVLNRGAVDWKSSKQSTTTMSAIEAEYIAASEAAMEVV
nr:retrotransposon protein, putative, Ty1-copia subclass [Tanacetum cinerariifolium]